MIKKILINLRTLVKFICLIAISTLLIVGAVAFLYKPIYSVTMGDELLGYCKAKSELQSKLEEYMGGNQEENIAFVEIEEMPKYKLCLLKRNKKTNDEEILEEIKSTGIPYYKYYAILEDDEEKLYVQNFETAENVVNGLKEKDSSNIENISILEKYETEKKEFITSEEAVANLYKEKEVQKEITVASASTTKNTYTSSTPKSVSTKNNISKSYATAGVSFIKPVTGTITSRFGASSSLRSGAHTGLDIAASQGTPIAAAASGTVDFAGYKGSYGYMVVISHSSSVQTYYGHCSKLYVSAGQKVTQGQKIAAVGSTGNSTGPHLHLEVRINGVAYNPQNYVY